MQTPVLGLRTTSAWVTVAALCNTQYLRLPPRSVFKHVAPADRIKKLGMSSTFSLDNYSAHWHKRLLRLPILESVLAFPTGTA